jgi:hypothetical protein
MNSTLRVFLLWLIPTLVFAQDESGIGFVARNMIEPVSLFAQFINAGCFLVGGSFLFASIIKYIEHRRSPLMVPISTVVFLFIAGLLLIGLPFVYLLTKYTG